MCNNIELTEIDKNILESYKLTIDGLAAYLGNGYEIILHSLENLEHSVIKIINGHYTNRRIGSPITNLALSMLSSIKNQTIPESITYFNKKDNIQLKSTTIPIQGENFRIIGLLCINFYMNIELNNFIEEFIPNYKNISSESKNFTIETFDNNLNDLIINTINKSKELIYKDDSISTSNKNKAIIHMLYREGIFNIKDSVNIVSKSLNIAKSTVYLHLKNM